MRTLTKSVDVVEVSLLLSLKFSWKFQCYAYNMCLLGFYDTRCNHLFWYLEVEYIYLIFIELRVGVKSFLVSDIMKMQCFFGASIVCTVQEYL